MCQLAVANHTHGQFVASANDIISELQNDVSVHRRHVMKTLTTLRGVFDSHPARSYRTKHRGAKGVGRTTAPHPPPRQSDVREVTALWHVASSGSAGAALPQRVTLR